MACFGGCDCRLLYSTFVRRDNGIRGDHIYYYHGEWVWSMPPETLLLLSLRLTCWPDIYMSCSPMKFTQSPGQYLTAFLS